MIILLKGSKGDYRQILGLGILIYLLAEPVENPQNQNL